jgi:ferritin-like metal-binding protein YciE
MALPVIARRFRRDELITLLPTGKQFERRKIMESLQDLLIEELKDLYSAEKQIVKALPKLVKGAQSKELKAALSEHLEVTKAQVTRLEEVFAAAGEKPSAKQCKGMEGLLEEGSEFLNEEEAGEFRDLQLIGAAQKVEHYEIAAYGTALAIAEQCGLQECADLLAETLEEEESADESLTTVAEGIYAAVGGQGASSSGDDSDSDDEDDEEEEEMEEPEMASVKGASKAAPAKAMKSRK